MNWVIDICITRPRRFGKTVNANMLAAYYCKEYDTKDIFDQLKIAQCDSYLKNLNQYNVIYMNMAAMPRNCQSYNEYISYIEKNLILDLKSSYTIDLSSEYPISEYFYQTKDSFVFILDEL